MDQEVLVTSRVSLGRDLLNALRQRHIDVHVAAWIQTSMNQIWTLYVATSLVGQRGQADAYREFYPIINSLPDSWLLQNSIRLIDSTDPIATDAMAILELRPGVRDVVYDGRQIGNLIIEEAYIYR